MTILPVVDGGKHPPQMPGGGWRKGGSQEEAGEDHSRCPPHQQERNAWCCYVPVLRGCGLK